LDWTDLRNGISPFVSRHPSYRGHPFVFFSTGNMCRKGFSLPFGFGGLLDLSKKTRPWRGFRRSHGRTHLRSVVG
jgi:hypothetical protein